ncbi:MAG: hypothetical protein KDJ73_01140 [Notoacmeibacter sp.]|nr:hypothetical protein [Notoacmeibacter sp.]
MRIASLTIAAMLAAMPVAQAGEEAPWEAELRAQALDMLNCQVDTLLNVQTGTLSGKATIEARVQCADGRRYDGYRVEPDKLFRFHACDTQVC